MQNLLGLNETKTRIFKGLGSPGIETEESIPPAYVARRASTTNRVVVPARLAGNRFLGCLKGLQFGLSLLHGKEQSIDSICTQFWYPTTVYKLS
jgi:hypothetical protein